MRLCLGFLSFDVRVASCLYQLFFSTSFCIEPAVHSLLRILATADVCNITLGRESELGFTGPLAVRGQTQKSESGWCVVLSGLQLPGPLRQSLCPASARRKRAKQKAAAPRRRSLFDRGGIRFQRSFQHVPEIRCRRLCRLTMRSYQNRLGHS